MFGLDGDTVALVVGIFTLGACVRVGSRLRVLSWLGSWFRHG